MVQLKTGGAVGVVDGLDGKKAILFLSHEDRTAQVTLTVGEKSITKDLTGATETMFELTLENDPNELTLTAVDENGQTITITDMNGRESESLTMSVEKVTELTGSGIPEILSSMDPVRYSIPRKVYGDGSGILIALHGDRKEVVKGDYLFEGVVQGDEEESMFYECEEVEGFPFWSIQATYRLFYLGARVRLIGSTLSKEPTRGARHVDQVLLDVTSLMTRFPYHLSKELPDQLVVKKSGGVVLMEQIDKTALKEMLLTGKDEQIAEMGNVSFPGGTGESTYEVLLSTGDHVMSDLVTVTAYEGTLDTAKLISFKDGTDYMVHAVIEAEEAAIRVTDVNDIQIEHVKVVPVIGKTAVFAMSESLVTQGMRGRVAYKKDGKWSPVSETTLLDVSSTYGVKPTNVMVTAKERSAIIGFDVPTEGRYVGTLLYHEGKATRDVRGTGMINVTALEPDTSYTFEIAHYDIDGFESERVPVTVVTKEEANEPTLEPMAVFIDNVKMTYKI